MASFGLEMGTMWLTEKPTMPTIAWYWQRCFSLFGVWALTAPPVINESTSLTIIKSLYLPISYLSFLCISISVVVPSVINSSICVGVEHCISKLQAVEEFDRRNGLNPCRQHEVMFTWFTRYSFLQFANCIEFVSKTSSVSLLLTTQHELQIGELPPALFYRISWDTTTKSLSGILI